MKSILIIEDDPFLLRMYKTRFEQEDCQVVVVDSGDKAIEMIEKKTFTIILLDIMLPKIGGLTILEKIKKSIKNKVAKVVVISSLVNEEQKKKAIELGACEFLDKAKYTPSQVVGVVKRYLSKP